MTPVTVHEDGRWRPRGVPPLPTQDSGGSWRQDGVGRWYVALWQGPTPTEALTAWAHRPDCGAVVSFAGTTRDHGVGEDGAVRTGVTLLDYEAYEGPALDRMASVAEAVCATWPDCRSVVVVHRLGPVPLGETSVLVAVAAPHRDDAFAAARHAIDTTKATVPIWKHEHHDAGVDWGADATPLAGPATAPSGGAGAAVVRGEGPVTDTGGVARRAAATGKGTGTGGVAASPDPQERAWAT